MPLGRDGRQTPLPSRRSTPEPAPAAVRAGHRLNQSDFSSAGGPGRQLSTVRSSVANRVLFGGDCAALRKSEL